MIGNSLAVSIFFGLFVVTKHLGALSCFLFFPCGLPGGPPGALPGSVSHLVGLNPFPFEKPNSH